VADSRIDELRRRIERDPGSRLFAQLAEEHRKAGEHAEAIRVARAGLVQHPSYPSARLTLGRALLDSGDPVGARAELEAALRDAPDNILASRFLGQALAAAGELGPALVQLQKTLKLAPGDRQLEGQIVALQAKLGTAPSSAAASAPPAAVDRGLTSPLPTSAVVLPTIPMQRPGDPARWAHRPVPPPLPPTAVPGAPPAPPPAGPPPASATPQPEANAPLFSEPFYESDVAPTQPTGRTPGRDAAAGHEGELTLPTAPSEALLEEVTAPAATPLASSTLAELYYRQGLGDRAIEVYRQLLADEPGNERARTRLGELEREVASSPQDARAARRRTLERTIAGLEGLLAALRPR
jgi:predicted Zn-dependent protease